MVIIATLKEHGNIPFIFFSVAMIMLVLIKDGRVEKLLVRETVFPMLIVLPSFLMNFKFM